jgi:serine/threonine protein phosphatase PrpC
VPSGKVKQTIMAVFDGLGGWEAMLTWAQKNQDLFYGTIYPKLLPTEGYEKGSGPIRVLVYAPQQSPTDKQVVLLDTALVQPMQAAEQAEERLDGNTT